MMIINKSNSISIDLNKLFTSFYILLVVQFVFINLNSIYLVDSSRSADSSDKLNQYKPKNDRSRTLVSKNGNIKTSLSDLNDLYFEVIYPEDIRYTYRIKIATGFGSSFQKTYKKTQLVPVVPFEACSALINDKELVGKVALVRRGECSFLTKTLNVEDAGAIAVIIADNDPANDNLIDMIADNTERVANIPAAFLQWKDGYMIKKSIEAHNLKAATINIPLNLTFKSDTVLKRAPWAYW